MKHSSVRTKVRRDTLTSYSVSSVTQAKRVVQYPILTVGEAGSTIELVMAAMVPRLDWFFNILTTLRPGKDVLPDGTPEEMIREASGRAFKLSTALGLIPGPLGWAVILPEVAALTRLQIDLVRGIALYHRQEQKMNREITLLIFANAMGVTFGEIAARRVGATLVIRAASTRVVRRAARLVGSAILDRAVRRAIGRWIPIVVAPVFGYFSRSMTVKIGREADRFFVREIRIEGTSETALSS